MGHGVKKYSYFGFSFKHLVFNADALRDCLLKADFCFALDVQDIKTCDAQAFQQWLNVRALCFWAEGFLMMFFKVLSA